MPDEPSNHEVLDAKHAAATSGAQPESQYIDALLEERRGYAIHGRTDRVAEVDVELERRGYKAAAEARSAAKPSGAPKARRSAPTEEA